MDYLFRAADLDQAGAMIAAMVTPFASDAFLLPDTVVTAMTPLSLVALAAGSLVFLLPGRKYLGRWLGDPALPTSGQLASLLYTAAAGVVAGLFVLSGAFSPFLYFQF